VSSPLAHATGTEWNKVLGFRRPNILAPNFAGVSVLVTGVKWTVGMKKRALAFATPDEKSDSGSLSMSTALFCSENRKTEQS